MGECMKIKYIDDVIIIYLRDIFDKDLERLAKIISNKLNSYYNLDLKGFYRVNVYIDKKYGTVLEYIDEGKDLYFNFSKLELNVNKYEENFLYEIEDIFYPHINEFIIYKNKYYIDKNIDEIEISNIIYKNTKIIKKEGIVKKLK